jgi:hypothetical protein
MECPVHSLQLNVYEFVRFEIITALVMKNTLFWDVAPCSLVE